MQTDKQTGRETDIETGRETDKETDRQQEREDRKGGQTTTKMQTPSVVATWQKPHGNPTLSRENRKDPFPQEVNGINPELKHLPRRGEVRGAV